jgi:antitoxin HigA-1
VAKTGYRMKNPAHPGGFVKTEIIEPLGLTVTDAARALGVTRAALSTLLNERASLSADMAIRIEKAFGVSMETLLRMQMSYDIARAHEREDEIDVERLSRGLSHALQARPAHDPRQHARQRRPSRQRQMRGLRPPGRRPRRRPARNPDRPRDRPTPPLQSVRG